MSTQTVLRSIAILILVVAGAFIVAPSAHAVDPTELEPAEAFDPGVLTLELEGEYDKYNDYEAEAEANLEYAFSDKLGLRLHVPVEFEENEDTEFGDVGVRLKYVFNPDAGTAPIVALSGEVFAPTGDDSSGIGGEVMFTISKALGAEEKNKLHLMLVGDYNNNDDDEHDHWGDDDGERDFYYEAVVGYSYDVSDQTTLVADFVRKQLETDGDNANIVEVGIKHDFNESFSGALGVGAGIGEESPDFTVRGGIEFRFGPK